jgi:hypothetical protein
MALARPKTKKARFRKATLPEPGYGAVLAPGHRDDDQCW